MLFFSTLNVRVVFILVLMIFKFQNYFTISNTNVKSSSNGDKSIDAKLDVTITFIIPLHILFLALIYM